MQLEGIQFLWSTMKNNNQKKERERLLFTISVCFFLFFDYFTIYLCKICFVCVCCLLFMSNVSCHHFYVLCFNSFHCFLQIQIEANQRNYNKQLNYKFLLSFLSLRIASHVVALLLSLPVLLFCLIPICKNSCFISF